MKGSKKRLSLGSIGLLLLFLVIAASCGKSQKEMQDGTEQMTTEESSSSAKNLSPEKLIQELQSFNTSLSQTQDKDKKTNIDSAGKTKKAEIKDLTPETLIAAYKATKKTTSEEDYSIGLSCGLDSNATKVGILLERLLSEIEKGGSEQAHNTQDLSETESKIINSPDLKEDLDKITSGQGNIKFDEDSLSDSVMNLFTEAILSCHDKKEIDNTVKFYTSKVKQCDTITEENRESLFAGFAIAAYSYNFWSTK